MIDVQQIRCQMYPNNRPKLVHQHPPQPSELTSLPGLRRQLHRGGTVLVADRAQHHSGRLSAHPVLAVLLTSKGASLERREMFHHTGTCLPTEHRTKNLPDLSLLAVIHLNYDDL